MKGNLKYFFFLIILCLGLIYAGIILRAIFLLEYATGGLVTLSLSFALIAAISLIIFLRGAGREEKEELMHSFVAISLKFLLELFLALIWFLIAKKTSATYVILFFVLYLSFSIFLIGVMLKILKKKSL
jgi:hypothetical protein